MRQPPCKDCHSKGCGPKHDTCEEYQEWKAERAAQTQQLSNQRKIQSAIMESVLLIKRKAKK